VITALTELGERPMLVHTGQHYDRAMSEVFFDELQMPEPERNLGVGSGSHGAQTAALLTALEDLFIETEPARVVVYGDINSTIAAAISAAKLQIPIAHVEAGLRSFDRSMPEEVNRVVTDALSDLHFVTSPEGMSHLAREGIADRGMHFVGNPMIDTLLRFRGTLDIEGMRKRLQLTGEYGVVTLHRPANVDDPAIATRIIEGLRRASRHLPLIAPIHPRGRERLTALGLGEYVTMLDPLGYLDFMALVSDSAVVLTDSGGIQEETTVLGIPCVTLRENTERPITVTAGTNTLVGSDPDSIEQAVVERASSTGRIPPLWDGMAGQRIAATLTAD